MKIGIMGAGRIAGVMSRTLRAMRETGRPVELYAIASRSAEKAEAFAKEQGVEKAYGSYDQLLSDPSVELVYIATPHSHHAEEMLACIKAGKPVLCEKSFTANAAQAECVLQSASEAGVYVTEAIWTRYMPSRAMLGELIASGVIGEPRQLTANLGYAIAHNERIFNPALAGGALLDVGVYVLNFASMVFGNDIARMESSVSMMPTGVDMTEDISLYYRDGRVAHLMATAEMATDRRCVVYGTKGALTVDNVNNPSVISLYTPANSLIPAQTWEVPRQLTGYEYEVEACLRDIPLGRVEAPEMPHAETLTLMRQMDALRKQWGMRYPFE